MSQPVPAPLFLTYKVKLRYASKVDRLLVAYEGLTHVKPGDFRNFVGFGRHSRLQRFRGLGFKEGWAIHSPMTGADRVTRMEFRPWSRSMEAWRQLFGPQINFAKLGRNDGAV